MNSVFGQHKSPLHSKQKRMLLILPAEHRRLDLTYRGDFKFIDKITVKSESSSGK
jgi:hypothetical protein